MRQVSRAAQLPVLVDGDTGFGEALNVMHMVRAFEDAGAAAVQIEDQQLPKKCGHLNDKKLVRPDEMAAKIAAAAKARRHLYIVARTDAAESEGLPRRHRAGAALYGSRRRRHLPRGAARRGRLPDICPEAVKAPLLANMTEFGRSPAVTADELQALGYKMVIWPVSALRMAAKAHADLYAGIVRDGGTHRFLERMQTRAELYETIGYHDFEALDSSIVASVVPETPRQAAKR